jgi:hypothetical protein
LSHITDHVSIRRPIRSSWREVQPRRLAQLRRPGRARRALVRGYLTSWL